ncbi:receptor like protein 29-like [Neltuma alba]|uniref:receptor like protein 29-like n=1 Tax=Neltuma alba TaxID=207710 RepID=UPI0010A3A59E|nr:receptor like protein 29-like [Prosopis alba]XP_028804566.1 receptor like protein 29-like [Prosopis alba]
MAMGVSVLKNEVAMEEEELLGLLQVMGALLEDPDWVQEHPQPCTDTPWPGVKCEVSDDDPQVFHVTEIHVGPDIVSPPCKSSAYLSVSLLKLPYLKTLSIFNCFVSSPVTLPATLFRSLSSLEHLALQSNPSLSGELPPSLGQAARLGVLSLSQNNLQGQIPPQIGGLVCLEQLDLSYNNLSGPIPKDIGNLKSMTILDLSGNEIEGNLPSSLGKLQDLQKIDLNSNRLTGEVPSDLGKLKRLVLLDLSHNFLSGPIPETLSSLEVLEYFVIDGNPIKARIPLFIGNLKNLKSVSFSGCGLIGRIPNCFSTLKNLTALSLDNNSLSGPVPPSLGSLLNLDQLNLSHNKLSGVIELPDDFIEKLGERLDIRGNSELCISHQPNKENLSSYLEIPACLSSKPGNGKSLTDEPPEDPAEMKPTQYSSFSSSWLHLEVTLFALITNFVIYSFFFLL